MPSKAPPVVPMKKPSSVERKVKAISVKASPSWKKITPVDQMALGCDQKKGSMNLVRAATSQPPTNAMRMEICTSATTQPGQSRRTGRRRTGRGRVSGDPDRRGTAAQSERADGKEEV